MRLPTSLYDLPRTLLGFHVAQTAPGPPTAASLEDRVARLEARAEISTLLNRYAYCYDAGDIENMMSIYSDDCVLVNGSGTFIGTDSIRSNYEQAILDRAVAFHHLADVEIILSDDNLEGWATGYLHNLAVRDGNPGGTMASFVFHVRKNGMGWLVAECRIAVTNQHSFGPPTKRSPVPKIAKPTRPDTVADLFDRHSASG
jgi:ketosteroid isomerase-like protein